MDSLADPNAKQSMPAFHAELLTRILAAQSSDGGWPFHSGGDARVEPTCWALLALGDSSVPPSEKMSAGLRFLASEQRKDGSWPASHGMDGGWVTSLACSVLARFPKNETVIAAGLEWLCDDYPRDSSGWQKFLKKLHSNKHIVSHNDEFRGWGWTPRTSSWVEPTSFALMAFAAAPASVSTELTNLMKERAELATGLLYDRMCPRGGWNCGNPRVYGVDGDPLVAPTCLALLALRSGPDHPNRALSLEWLQSEYPKIKSAGSLSLAQITLEMYGVPFPPATLSLLDWSAAQLLEQGTHVAAWAALAFNSRRFWPASVSR